MNKLDMHTHQFGQLLVDSFNEGVAEGIRRTEEAHQKAYGVRSDLDSSKEMQALQIKVAALSVIDKTQKEKITELLAANQELQDKLSASTNEKSVLPAPSEKPWKPGRGWDRIAYERGYSAGYKAGYSKASTNAATTVTTATTATAMTPLKKDDANNKTYLEGVAYQMRTVAYRVKRSVLPLVSLKVFASDADAHKFMEDECPNISGTKSTLRRLGPVLVECDTLPVVEKYSRVQRQAQKQHNLI